MGIWVELHCDNQSPATDARGRMACVSGSGDQPGAMTLRKPAETARALIAQAKRRGWVIAPDGTMTCPNCAAYWKSQAGERK